MLTPEQIQSMVEVIDQAIHPEKIILFGSYAKGSQTPNSDIDLLIVKQSDLPPRHRSAEVKKLLRSFHIPKDIIVVTPTEFNRYQHWVGTIIRPAVLEGNILYG